MKDKAKVMVLWVRKGCRKPKMQGTATSSCSAATVATFRRMADRGAGRLWIVEGRTAAEARAMIKGWRQDQKAVGVSMVTDSGRTVALGHRAVLAIGGAAEACAKWDARIQAQGRVTVDQSRALTEDMEVQR